MSGERLDYRIERQRHETFIGRAEFLEQLDQLLVADAADRWVLVTGGLGMGKSALLAWWLTRRERAGDRVPHHFIRRGEYDWDDPVKLVGSLVAQIEDQFPSQRDPDIDARVHPAARLAATLARVSANELVPGSRRLVILIDGLDEYDPLPGARGADPLAAFLPHALPPGVSFLCASRPRHLYVSGIEARSGELVRIDLDAPEHAASNDATVRGFWEREARALGLPERFIDEAVARAGGNLQHATMLRKYLANLPPAKRRVHSIPDGLEALLDKLWDRVAADPLVVHGLGILCAAREALTLEDLGVAADWAEEAQRRAFLTGAGELLVETRRPDGRREYRLNHLSIREYIARALGERAIRDHHAALAARIASWPLPADATTQRYALRHGLTHRAEAGDWADAWRLAADTSFLKAKYRELGAHDAEADVARAAERSSASGDEVLRRQFVDLVRALVRESHWLREAPEATAGLIWNRLRRFGWSADDLDEQLRIPAGANFLRVRHAATRESPALVRDLVGHTNWVTTCMVMPDGRRAVSASRDRTLKVWDLDSGIVLATLEGHANDLTVCAVMPDGRHLMSSGGHKIFQWDLEGGRLVATFETDGWMKALMPDGRRAVLSAEDRSLRIWDLHSGRVLATLLGHTGPVSACAMTSDGRRLVSASSDHTVKVWDLDRERPLVTFEGHDMEVFACIVTPDGRRVISGGNDGMLVAWDIETGRVLTTFEDHRGALTACTVTHDSQRVVSASIDRTLRVWDLDTGRVLAVLEGHTRTVTACAVTRDGKRVVSASEDHSLKVWDLESGRAATTSEGHTDRVNACVVTPDDRRVISASSDVTLKVWEQASGHVLATFEGDYSAFTGCAVTSDGQLVVSASDNHNLAVWDLASGAVLVRSGRTPNGLTGCAVIPDDRRVVFTAWNNMLRVWDLESGRIVASFKGHASWLNGCAVVPDGRRAISASHDRTLKAWDLDDGKVLVTYEGHTSAVNACAVTLDGRRVVSASDDHTLKVWDLDSGRELATLHGHANKVLACAVTPDGRRVVSGSDDHTLKVWDLASGACLLTHHASAGFTAVAATETTIIAGDAAGSVWFLDWPSPHDQRTTSPDTEPSSPRPPMKQHTSPSMSPAPARVDIGILTIRDDELRAVLTAFPDKAGIFKGKTREYTLRHADAGHGERYTVAVLRQVEQGNGEAQDAARDLLDDLAPKLVLVVGIAGALPSDDVKLGDVVLSTRIHDFTVEARKAGQPSTYAASGGAIAKALSAAVANLAAREDELGNWTDGLPAQPSVSWTRNGQLYGPPKWQSELRAKLEHHYPKRTAPRAPVYIAGTIASSDRLVKDPKLLFPWIATARDILAVEMESGGVYRAARERCPMLAIRGISDIVGLKRSDAWTKFACASAAAFTRAYLRTQPVPVDAPAPPSPKPAGLSDFSAERARHVQFVGSEPEAFASPLPPARKEGSADSMLIVTAGGLYTKLTDAPIIREVWTGPIVHLLGATRNELVRELRKSPSIIHIEAQIDANSVMLEDGPVSASRLRELLRLDSKNINLVVLSSCQSFKIGKALENSGVRAALVATSNLNDRLARLFFRSFYRLLAENVPVNSAFERTKIELEVLENITVADTLFLSEYERY